jgi:hypothetical protein
MRMQNFYSAELVWQQASELEYSLARLFVPKGDQE